MVYPPIPSDSKWAERFILSPWNFLIHGVVSGVCYILVSRCILNFWYIFSEKLLLIARSSRMAPNYLIYKLAFLIYFSDLYTKVGWSINRNIWTVFLRYISDIWTMCISDMLCLSLQKWTRWLEAWHCADFWLLFEDCYIYLQYLHPQRCLVWL
jgi:hypothetical protein